MRLRRSAVLLVLTASFALAGCGGDDSSGSDGAAADAGSSSGCDWVKGGQAAKKVDLPGADVKPAAKAVLTTNRGDITITFDEKKRCTVTSFTSLAEQGYYDKSPCHRVSANAPYGILQCGDPTGTGTGGPGYTIPDELDGSETYPRGTVAMANTGAPDSGGGQFFLTYQDSPFPASYTEFGTIDEAGLKVLEAIAADGTADGSTDGAPKEPVVVESVELS